MKRRTIAAVPAVAVGVMLSGISALSQSQPPTQGAASEGSPPWFLLGSFPDPTGRTVVDASGQVVGLVDESDVLAALLMEGDDASKAFARPVEDVMVTRLETISADAPIADLVPLFRKDYIAIVMDGDQFLGVATRLDLINYFRITP